MIKIGPFLFLMHLLLEAAYILFSYFIYFIFDVPGSYYG